MTTLRQLQGARVPGPDFAGRLANALHMIEEYLKDALDIPETLNVKHVLILARFARHERTEIYAGDLERLGFFVGTNASYNLSQMIASGYIEANEGLDKRRRWIKLTKHGKLLGEEAAIHLSYIEEHVGQLFSRESYRETCGFLGETIHPSLTAPRAQREKA